MRKRIYMLIAGAMLLAGCGNQEELEQRNNELMRELASKDRFIEDVTSTINEIHNSLENAWAMERGVVQQTASGEGSTSLTAAELKDRILSRIGDMRIVLAKNRQRAADLEKRLRTANTQYAGLERMVVDLKRNLDERERSIAVLGERVQNLEDTVVQKTQIISAHEIAISEQENMIAEQRKKLNTVYFTAGKRSDLKERGIIEDEGGIFWGLTGTTTVLTAINQDGKFEPFDKTKETAIPVPGAINEIIPKRDTSSYAIQQMQNGTAVLVIVKPDEFWREKYLAIVTE